MELLKVLKSLLIIGIMTLVVGHINAQVTIGSDAPPQRAAVLDLRTKVIEDDNVSSEDGGIIFTRVKLENTETLEPFIDINDEDWKNNATTKIKSLHTGLVVYNLNTTTPFSEGLYIWNGKKWISLSSQGSWQVSNTTDIATSNNQNIYQMGQVSIGNSKAVEASAILRVDATDKGVLLPRVKLTARDDKTTIKDPATALLVYNEGTSTFPIKGYMFWNGIEWRAINTTTTVAPNAIISCGEVRLDPEQVIEGGKAIPAGTVLKIPYTVGNGGLYNGVVLQSEGNPNITATLYNGQFESGSGFLNFFVEGVPVASQASPTGITFDLTPFYNANPSLTGNCVKFIVGDEIKANFSTSAVIDNLKLTNDAGVKGYATSVTSPDGKFSVRAMIVDKEWNASAASFGAAAATALNLQIRNNTSEDVIIAGVFSGLWATTIAGSGNNRLGLQPGKWSGDSYMTPPGTGNYVYWANYVSTEEGIGFGTTAPAMVADIGTNPSVKKHRGIFVYLGGPGVYKGGIPERRTYSWIINDGAKTKTAYILTFSSSALNPDDYATPTTCPNGICVGTKVFMTIDQITAP